MDLTAPIIEGIVMADELLPIEVEKKLLSALMLKSGNAIPEAAVALELDDFTRPEHKLIFKALCQLSEENIPVDVLLVEKALRKSGDLAKVTRAYLYGLMPLEYTTLRVPQYVKEIKEQSSMRKLATLGEYISDAAKREQPLAQIVTTAERMLTDVSGANEKREVISIAEAAVNYFTQLQENPKGRRGLKTGLNDLDALIGGLNKSDLIIIAARPSMGKSALAINIAAHVAKKKSVLLFSLEMSLNQVVNRLYALASGVHATRIQYKTYSDKDAGKVVDACDRLAKLHLFLDDTAGLSLMAMKMKARRIKKEHGLDLIVLDYLQLMTGSGRYRDNRVQEVSELSRGLKAMARELDIPIIALSQLSRSVELRGDKRPVLSDLRESGSIEQDADIVMFLYRDEYYNRDADNPNLAEIIVAKNRNGETGIKPFYFDKGTQKFTDITEEG